MKTQHLRKSCKLFLTASKCDICYAPLKVNWLLAVGCSLLTACYLVFYFAQINAQTAQWLWHALLLLFASSAALIYLTKRYFFESQSEQLTIALPEHEINWRQGTYVADSASRLSFLGFWLVLLDKTEVLDKQAAGLAGKNTIARIRKNVQCELFIYRSQLNYQQVCYLSYLIKAAQKHR